MHFSVFLWVTNSVHLPNNATAAQRLLEFFKNYFLSQFISFTRKSVLLLYNYTFVLKLYYPAWSPPDLPLLALNWLGCFQKSKPLSKDEDLPLLKMCLRLWRQFPKRSPKNVYVLPQLPLHGLPASSPFSNTPSGSCSDGSLSSPLHRKAP